MARFEFYSSPKSVSNRNSSGFRWHAITLEQPETIGIVIGLQFSFKLRSSESRHVFALLPGLLPSCDLYNFSLGHSSTYLGLPGITLRSIFYLTFPTPFQSDCWKHEPCVHTSRGCLDWAVWLGVCPLWRPHQQKTGKTLGQTTTQTAQQGFVLW